MIEPRSCGVLDAPLQCAIAHKAGDDAENVARSFRVIASHPVGAKRRRMTGSAMQSIEPRKRREWIASSQGLLAMTWKRRGFAFSRHDYPRFCIYVVPREIEGAGNAGCALHPRSRVQDAQRKAHTSIQVQRRQSGIPCAMALRLMPCSPRRRILFVTVASGLGLVQARLGRTHLRRLDISNGCQDHTVLPYATSAVRLARREPLTSRKLALRSPCASALPRPPHPVPRS